MAEATNDLYVKDEPSFEQLSCDYQDNYDQHTNVLNLDNLEACCLCFDGCKIQNTLIEHLQNDHPNGKSRNLLKTNFIIYKFILEFPDCKLACCDCSEGILLQVELLNHLLSHVGFAKNETEKITTDEMEVVEDEEQTAIISDSREQTKTKPSYHNKFNRRNRSPTTQKIQQEFTKDPGTKLFHCNFCRNGYKHKQTVERHLSKAHDYTKSGENFVDLGSEDLGFTIIPETRTFSCNLCPSSYRHKQTIERHLLREHKVEVPKTRLSNRMNNQIKIETVDRNKRGKYKNLTCDWCGKNFLFRESLRKHLLRHIEPQAQKTVRSAKEKIVCDQCTKLVEPSLMKRHFQVHHSDFRPFRCDEPGCKTSFFDKAKFNDHKNIHLQIKPYVCEFCQESFHYASNWRQHKLRHTDPDRFKCEVCSHCFVSTKSLRLHMRLHTEDSDAPKPFACEHEGCDKAFRYQDRLKLHVANVHRTETEHQCAL